MQGPFTIEVKIHLTDGEQTAVVTGNLGAGKIPTKQNIDDLTAVAMAKAKEATGGDWRPQGRNEFENELLAELTGANVKFATKDEWDPA